MSSKTLECQLTVMLHLPPQHEGVDHSDSRKGLDAAAQLRSRCLRDRSCFNESCRDVLSQ